MITYEHDETFETPREQLWAWHARPGAFRRLSPPWQNLRPISEPERLENGSRMVFDLHFGPGRLRWIAEHRRVEPGHAFEDVQIRGPFSSWRHRHEFTDSGDGGSRLRDRVAVRLPGGWLAERLGRHLLKRDLDRLFLHRASVLHSDLALHRSLGAPEPWTLAVSGASSPVGRALVAMATTGGHRVIELRAGDEPGGAHSAEVVHWSASGGIDPAGLPRLEDADAVVHLARDDDRASGTKELVRSLKGLRHPPTSLLSASRVGWYGDRGDRELTEDSEGGQGPLADRERQRETIADRASALGLRVVHLRFGLVLSPRDGLLASLLGPGRLGLAARLGSGEQQTSWISADDAAGAILHTIGHPGLEGPVNLTAPTPVSHSTLVRTLCRVLSRPTLVRIPARPARLLLGGSTAETVLTSTRAIPARLTESGYGFRHATVESALRYLLGRPKELE